MIDAPEATLSPRLSNLARSVARDLAQTAKSEAHLQKLLGLAEQEGAEMLGPGVQLAQREVTAWNQAVRLTAQTVWHHTHRRRRR